MRKFLTAAAGSVVGLVGFVCVAHSSATIDLIWDATGTNEMNDDSGSLAAVKLNVIFTAGTLGSEGAGVSVDFSEIGVWVFSLGYSNDPSVGDDSPLPLTIDFPYLATDEFRVELINSICLCDFGIGTGLAAGQSQQLGTVTFGFFDADEFPGKPVNGTYEFKSDANGLGDGVLYGDAVEDPDPTTFNSAFLVIPEPGGWVSLQAGIAMLALLYRRRLYSVER